MDADVEVRMYANCSFKRAIHVQIGNSLKDNTSIYDLNQHLSH